MPNKAINSDSIKRCDEGAPAPTPGVLGRAALGSCLAIGYMMYAAKTGVPLAGLEVPASTIA